MVDPETFEEARRLLAEAIEEAYQDSYLIPPIEVSPGHWFFWPIRIVEMTLEETRYWSYGEPGAGTGRLQAHIVRPYGVHERIKPRKSGKPFGKEEAERAARTARAISDDEARSHLMHHVAKQEAYLAGFEAVLEAEDEELYRLWPVRAAVYGEGNWDALHRAIHRFLKMGWGKQRGVLEWLPDEPDSYEEWGPFLEQLNESELYDMAMRGVLHGLDDWAIEEGLLVENEEGRRVIPG